jgi:hypothetical protein
MGDGQARAQRDQQLRWPGMRRCSQMALLSRFKFGVGDGERIRDENER